MGPRASDFDRVDLGMLREVAKENRQAAKAKSRNRDVTFCLLAVEVGAAGRTGGGIEPES
jgi:hypothetical protein